MGCLVSIFTLTLQSRPNKAGLNVRSCVRPSTNRFFDFIEIWHVGMHDGMQYDPIQSQGQGHDPFKVGNPAILTAIYAAIYNGKWQLTMDS